MFFGTCMIDISKIRFSHLEKIIENLKQAFTAYLDEYTTIQSDLKHIVFADSFFDSTYYLVLPYLFKKAFKERNSRFIQQICISGFLYFKYLICLDALHDKDNELSHAQSDQDGVRLLQMHIYHEEALKILATFFGKNTSFWKLWSQRNDEFLSSILLDKQYNPQMSFETYAKLCINKCSFSKVAVDAYYARSNQPKELYRALTQSLDYFSIARCIQDDLEDFKKDLVYQKNNLGHVLLNTWLESKGKQLSVYSPDALEQYLFTSETAEEMMLLSKSYYQKAIDEIEIYRVALPDYIQVVDSLRNRINYFKVNTQAYRINKLLKKVTSTQLVVQTELPEAITRSRKYIETLQNNDGSWFEVSNMQGLSNVWSTGYIASFLGKDNPCLTKASYFLLQHQQDHLWGYNTDWTADYDSTTSVLFTLYKAEEPIRPYLEKWLVGQTEAGGFRTYSDQDFALTSNLGLNVNQIKGWTSNHVCVSALAYYFLNHLPIRNDYQLQRNLLKSYLLRNRSKKGVWQPYWWTSFLYPTCYVLQGMLLDEDDFGGEIKQTLQFILSQQNKDGSFSCEVLKQKSVFYTALVLDTLCASPDLFMSFKAQAVRMKDWILTNQYEDGAFAGSNFLVIPKPATMKWQPAKHPFKVNSAGGGNSVTGEIANLFSTAVSLRALDRYHQLTLAEHGHQ